MSQTKVQRFPIKHEANISLFVASIYAIQDMTNGLNTHKTEINC